VPDVSGWRNVRAQDLKTDCYRLNSILADLDSRIVRLEDAPASAVKRSVDLIVGDHAVRLTMSGQQPGTLFFEQDRTVLYLYDIVNGASGWFYLAGICYAIQSQKPTDLTAYDQNFLWGCTDYVHLMQWSGSFWTFAPGDNGSDYLAAKPNSTIPAGWVECTGAATTYLKSDGTTGSYTTPSMAGTYFRR
jgi:hypothetical protein